ncbi:M48 family metallopeptidase [Cobetia crustatorum]|uniref:M48 family metallopeptidase n=1 Tax=Cobetia crustatorum TaxID=553385 RepID=UPI0024A9C637|nr:M48 family metalloprotease [Cobetia crustatorum]
MSLLSHLRRSTSSQAIIRPSSMRLPSILLGILLLSTPAVSVSAAAQNDYGLPDLGSASGGISNNDEYRIGRAWLRQFRAHVREWGDPITLDWIGGLVRQLAPWSELDDRNFIITLVASSQLNAFAVPGGVVGVNTGLFAFAPDRDAFASVLAHELGHLSQHHFARNMERQAETRLPTLAGFLAGMVIAAGGGGSAGIAAMAGTQLPPFPINWPTHGASSKRPIAWALKRCHARASIQKPCRACSAPCSVWLAYRATMLRSSC